MSRPPSAASLPTLSQSPAPPTSHCPVRRPRPRAARDEIEQSLTMRCFDKIVINDKLDDAYSELTQTLLEL